MISSFAYSNNVCILNSFEKVYQILIFCFFFSNMYILFNLHKSILKIQKGKKTLARHLSLFIKAFWFCTDARLVIMRKVTFYNVSLISTDKILTF